jgi:hypothetical protein
VEMLSETFDVKLFDMMPCFYRAITFLHPRISGHHLRVAYIGAFLAEKFCVDSVPTQDALIAGAFRDVAAMTPAMRNNFSEEILTDGHSDKAHIPDDLNRHGFDGSLMLHDFPHFTKSASAIHFRQVDWDPGRGVRSGGSWFPWPAMYCGLPIMSRCSQVTFKVFLNRFVHRYSLFCNRPIKIGGCT